MHALAAGGAGFRRSPRFVQIRNDLGVDAAPHHVPGMRALDLVANPDATRAQNAAVVIDDEAVVRGVDIFFRIAIRKAHMRNAETLRQHLHLAVTVRDADRADMIALGEQQLKDHAAVVLQALGVGGDFHALFDHSDAGRKQLVLALNLDKAKPAGADVGEAVHFAEPRNKDAVLPGNVEDGFFLASAQIAAVDSQRFDGGDGSHAVSPSAWATQTPAGHLWS